MNLQLAFIISTLINSIVSSPTIAQADFDLVGYAKSNPKGETTGGAGGSTTTVTSADALKTAVAVR